MNVKVVLSEKNGNVVPASAYVLKSDGVTGIDTLDGTSALLAGRSLVGKWQIIPLKGLGGDDPVNGKEYYAKAEISYFVNGVFVETSTEGVSITIYPQPQIKLHYYVPHKVYSGTPFKLGVCAENNGSGYARNLTIDSGKLDISTNTAGLQTDFEIIGGS